VKKPSSWKHVRPTKRMVADQLRAFVARHGITQVAVAKAIGCSGVAVCNALQGKCGSFELYDSIAWGPRGLGGSYTLGVPHVTWAFAKPSPGVTS
jgi:hypothetical protein